MSEAQRNYAKREIAGLAFSQVKQAGNAAPVRALGWFNRVQRMGMHLPLFAVHDLGLLLSASHGAGGWHIRPAEDKKQPLQLPPRVLELRKKYREFIVALAECDPVQKIAAMRPRDELIAVLLMRIVGDSHARWSLKTRKVVRAELPVEPQLFSAWPAAELAQAYDPQWAWGFLELVAQHSLHMLTCAELIDVDTVRLMGMFRDDGAELLQGSIDLVDLFAALGSAAAGNIANFSLELLPSVLETKRSAGVQRLAVDGYASLERSGHIDSLVLSDLAHDEDVFEQKVVQDELLYYSHEREREDERRLHYVLVDASASMRGKRQVFARGLALALIKKLVLAGDEVWFRFFDSRLHELQKASRNTPFPVPYLLSFRSEQGRHYARVFQQMSLEVARLSSNAKRRVMLYVITHGQCHIPAELVAALAKQCSLCGVFILPSAEMTLDFLPLLHKHHIVDAETLANRSARKARALGIVDDAAQRVKAAHG